MECVCGCGRKVPKDLADRNYLAANVAIELLLWDKSRALPGPEPEGREGLIARGVECYEKLLYSLHREGGGDPDAECGAWLDEARAMRAGRSGMTKRSFFARDAPNLSREDMDRLDRRHPERSFTGGREPAPNETDAAGGAGTRADSAAAARIAPADDDLVAQLERLRSMREDGALTDEEFAAAKARLLGRD